MITLVLSSRKNLKEAAVEKKNKFRITNQFLTSRARYPSKEKSIENHNVVLIGLITFF